MSTNGCDVKETPSDSLEAVQLGVAIFFSVLNAIGFLLTASIATYDEYVHWKQEILLANHCEHRTFSFMPSWNIFCIGDLIWYF